MTFQSSSARDIASSLQQPWTQVVKHASDYADLIQRMGADLLGISECASIAGRIVEASDDSWCAEWRSAGERSKELASDAALRGEEKVASLNWRRASIYLWAAELYLHYADARYADVVDMLRLCSRKYITGLMTGGEIVKIPGADGNSREGYLARSSVRNAPVVICVGGWDVLKEANVHLVESAIAKGVSVLLVDLPARAGLSPAGSNRFGATPALIACVDYLEGREDMKGRPFAVYGVGAGATLASQFAQMDDRICAVAVDVGSIETAQRNEVLKCFIDTDFARQGSPRFTAEPRLQRGIMRAQSGMSAEAIFGWVADSLKIENPSLC